MKTILFPTDLTATTTSALNWARLLTRTYDATLVLMHVHTPISSGGTLPLAGDMGMMTGVGIDVPLLDETYREQLAALATGLEQDGIKCQTDLRWGGVTDSILEAAQEHRADLIITGRSHMDSLFDRWLGTAASGVAQGAHCPVLVVPAQDTDETDLAVQPRTIVFSTPLEFDQDDEFRQIADLARKLNATLRVLHVQAENQPNLVDDDEMLSQLQAVYGPEPLLTDTVAARTVSGGLETYLESNAVDLLVMTTRERDFLTGLLNPSVTGRVLKSVSVPVLVYHAKGDL